MYVTKCHREQTDGPRSTNFGLNMHVDKERLCANVHSNRQRPWPHFKVTDSNRVHWQVHPWISHKRRQTEITLLLPTHRKSFDWLTYILSWSIVKVKVKVKVIHTFYCEYMANGEDKSKHYYCHMGFRLAYFETTYPEGQPATGMVRRRIWRPSCLYDL